MNVGNTVHTLLAITVNIVATVTPSSLKQVLAQVKCSCPALLGLLHPQSLLDTKGVLAALWGGDSTKVPGADTLRWELIISELSDIF